MLVRSLTEFTPEKTTALPDFSPPPRFGTTTFAGYQPQHPSQQRALEATQDFITRIQRAPVAAFRWPWQRSDAPQGQGLYLDGGFGVGKTHLLASAYTAFQGDSKVYLSFSELVHTIGILGKEQAQTQFGQYKLYCIDEFELDDPGNTLIVKTFLAYVFARGGNVITTSNTPPEAQGEGRFNASDFKREIQSIAEKFVLLGIEGPDYRKRDHLATLYSQEKLKELECSERTPEPKVAVDWAGLFVFLQAHHPIRYADTLKQIGTLYISGATTIAMQHDALRFVHFIDKLYDLKVKLRVSGDVPLEALFDSSYRNNAYAKKHFRCLSRLSELLEE